MGESRSETRDVTVRENNTKHLAELIAPLIDGIIEVHSTNMHNDAELRKERLDMFYEFRHEYQVSQKSRLFLGVTTAKEILEESDDYALSRMKKVFREISSTTDDNINRFIKLIEKVPPNFLEAIMTVFEGKRSGPRPKLTQGKNNVPDLTDILNFETGGENDKEPVKSKRGRFSQDFEEDSGDIL